MYEYNEEGQFNDADETETRYLHITYIICNNMRKILILILLQVRHV